MRDIFKTIQANILKILLMSVILFFMSGYFLINSTSVDVSFLDNEYKILIKKYLFPYTTISQQEQVIKDQEHLINEQAQIVNERAKSLSEQIIQEQNSKFQELQIIVNQISTLLELTYMELGSDIEIKKTSVNLLENLTLEKFQLLSGFYSGINNNYPGSGYIEFHNDNIIVMSSKGLLAYKTNLIDDTEKFKQIKTNINEFIGMEQFRKNEIFAWFSIKDILIFNETIFVSFTEEIKNDCWNTSIASADMDYENIKFTKLFSSQECIHSVNNVDGQFNAHQSGGRIISFDNNHILFSTGDYRSRHLAQNKKSVNGKVVKLNLLNGSYEIISMGHRNPQGLYFDKVNNIILETEHGPQGGDEINKIEVSKIYQDELQNYGWAISSAGEHYGGKTEKNKELYEKYPLHDSHSEHGYIEPVKSFVPSIGISEIVKIGKNKFVVSSLKDKSIYFFEIDEKGLLFNLNRVEVFERIRDLKFKNNQLYLFMEDTASIGVIDLG